jgi:hypothetical protein
MNAAYLPRVQDGELVTAATDRRVPWREVVLPQLGPAVVVKKILYLGLGERSALAYSSCSWGNVSFLKLLGI